MLNLEIVVFVFATFSLQRIVATSVNLNKVTPELIFRHEEGGEYIFTEDQPKLDLLHGVYEICNKGMWILFGCDDYHFGHKCNIDYTALEPKCVKRFYNGIGSVRFVGDRANYSTPSVTLFSERFYGGVSVNFREEIPAIGFNTISMITIDTETVQLFQQQNYNELLSCYRPTWCDATCSDSSTVCCVPDLERNFDKAQSAKTECT